MTRLEVIDTAVKIGLGAFIAAGSGYLVSRLGYRRDAQKVYIAAKRGHLDKVIRLLNDFHKTYPLVRSAMYHHFRRMENKELDTEEQKAEFDARRVALATAFLNFTDAEGYILAMGARNVNDALTKYIDVSEAFCTDARFDNSSFTRDKLDKVQASMHEARMSLLQAIAEEYKKSS